MRQIKLSTQQITLLKDAHKHHKEVEQEANLAVAKLNESTQRVNELIQMFCLTADFEPTRTTFNLDEGVAIEIDEESKGD